MHHLAEMFFAHYHKIPSHASDKGRYLAPRQYADQMWVSAEHEPETQSTEIEELRAYYLGGADCVAG
jgi:hypothetical protein